MSIASTILGVLSLAGAIVAFAWMFLRLRSRIPFKTFDEVSVVKHLMIWVASKLPEHEGQILLANTLLVRSYGIPALQSISRKDLATLAPFIDEWIEGRLPPQNLPAEYEDFRPRALLGFKQRLQSEGLWPPPPRSP